MTPSSFATSPPSFVRLTSNARMVAYSGLCSSMIDALITSFLWIGPMFTAETGIFEVCAGREQE